ncbi:MAG: DUF971 domain-containing protein [Caldithrix sp.]|nr:DUF971 domain-containing protein [Caldithrix sp.]
MKPKHIDQISDKVLTVVWDDGHESIYFSDHLRKNCPCAHCAKRREQGEEDKPFKILNINPQDITFTSWRVMGNYAMSFRFSDGHHTGIYPFEKLRELCQCDICTGNAIRVTGRSE